MRLYQFMSCIEQQQIDSMCNITITNCVAVVTLIYIALPVYGLKVAIVSTEMVDLILSSYNTHTEVPTVHL